MEESAGWAWSDQVGAADWIEPRLRSDAPLTVVSMVPAGFAGYARILHPAKGPAPGDRAVRWAEIAAWSGLPLRADSPFHSVALAQQRPAQAAPWSGPPEQGTLYPPDAAVLTSILRDWTATPDRCWFCVGRGYGDDPGPSVALTAVHGGPASQEPLASDPPDVDLPGDTVPLPDFFQNPVPEAVQQGPGVELPNDREYLLYTGPVEAAVGALGPQYPAQSASLWWPQDQAWCVVSDFHLPCTYVGGPAALIDQLVAEQRIEAQRTSPGDAVAGVEPWVLDTVTAAAEQLFACGEAGIETSLGTVRAYLRQPSWYRRGALRTSSDDGRGGTRGCQIWLSRGPGLHDEIVNRLIFDVIGLAEG